jgi:hypothetical protein
MTDKVDMLEERMAIRQYKEYTRDNAEIIMS